MMGKKVKIKVWIITLVGVFLALAGFWLIGSDGAVEGHPSIETAVLERGDIVQTVAASGSVRPLITVEVGSQLSGQVTQIFVDFNSTVVKGQVVAQIDARTFESRVLQAKADLLVANSTIIVQQANIDRARANLRKARLEYERAEPLAKTGTLSISEFDTALANFESAKADLTVTEAQLENARANREQRLALLESAEIDLERTRIRSPIDGVVIERSVDKGQTVAASLSSPVLFKIAQDLTEIQIEANVDEADIGNIKDGNAATFTVDAYPDSEFSGAVGQVRLAPNELNNVVTYTVIITASNPQRKLLPGMTAIVEIVTGKSEDVLRVANAALRFKPAKDSALATLLPATVGHTTRSSNGVGDMRGSKPRGAGRRQQPQHQAQQTRPGTLWIRSGNGEIKPARVRLGISDDRYTQILSRELQAGQQAVTRIRKRGK